MRWNKKKFGSLRLTLLLIAALASFAFATQYEQSLPNLCAYYNGTTSFCSLNPTIICKTNNYFPTLTCRAATGVCVAESVLGSCAVCGNCNGIADACNAVACGTSGNYGCSVTCDGAGTGAAHCNIKGGFGAACLCNGMCVSGQCNMTSNTCLNKYKVAPNHCGFYNGTSAACTGAVTDFCASGYYYPNQLCSATPTYLSCIAETAAASCDICGACVGAGADVCATRACGTTGFGCADICDGAGKGALHCNISKNEGEACNCNGMCANGLTCTAGRCRRAPANVSWVYPPANNLNVTGNPMCRMNYNFTLTNATADALGCNGVTYPLFGGIPPVWAPFAPDNDTSCSFDAPWGSYNFTFSILDSNGLINYTNQTTIDTMNFTCNQPAINMTWIRPPANNSFTNWFSYDFQFNATPMWNNTLYNITDCGIYLTNSTDAPATLAGTYNDTTYICDVTGYTYGTEDVWITGWASNAYAYNETEIWNFTFFLPNIPTNCYWIEPALNNSNTTNMTQRFRWACGMNGTNISACYLQVQNASGFYNVSGSMATEGALAGYGACFQEFANVSTSCGGLDSGIYWDLNSPNLLLFDGDYSTSNEGCVFFVYVNYTIPANADASSSSWLVGTATLNRTYNIPSSCWGLDGKVSFLIYTENCGGGYFSQTLLCQNQSGTQYPTFLNFTFIATIDGSGESFRVTEEAMNWSIVKPYCEANYSRIPNVSFRDYRINIIGFITNNNTLTANTPTWTFTYLGNSGIDVAIPLAMISVATILVYLGMNSKIEYIKALFVFMGTAILWFNLILMSAILADINSTIQILLGNIYYASLTLWIFCLGGYLIYLIYKGITLFNIKEAQGWEGQ